MTTSARQSACRRDLLNRKCESAATDAPCRSVQICRDLQLFNQRIQTINRPAEPYLRAGENSRSFGLLEQFSRSFNIPGIGPRPSLCPVPGGNLRLGLIQFLFQHIGRDFKKTMAPGGRCMPREEPWPYIRGCAQFQRLSQKTS